MKELDLQTARKAVAALLVALLATPLVQASPVPQQSQAEVSQQQNLPEAPAPAVELAQATPQQPAPAPDSPQLVDRSQQPPADQEPSGSGKPVGAAAAPVAKPTGVAASRPAGAAIAPAKQRHVKAILIRIGIIVGAGVAIGTVAALSRGSSARP